jgi:hypothetical protein
VTGIKEEKMKALALLFVVVWTLGLPLCELEAQDTVGTVITQRERKVAICSAYRAYLQGAPGLLNNRNGMVMSKDLISMGKGITQWGRSNKMTSAELKQMLKKASRPMTGTTQFYLIDTVIVHSTTDTERYSYSYNASGIASSSEEEVWLNGQWTNSWCDTLTYDASGHELTDLIELWQNGQWTNASLDTMTYDAGGHELTSLIKEWQNGQWTSLSLHTYTYDASGRELTDMEQEWLNGQWTNDELYTYTYDASGHELSFLEEYWRNGQWTNASLDTMTYDAGEHELTYLAKVWQNAQWTNSFLGTNTYDASGHLLTDLWEEWQSGEWTNSFLSTYTYDESGHLLTYLEEEWQDGQWTNSIFQTMTYDANQDLIAFSGESWQGSAWLPSDGGLLVFDGPNYEDYYGYNVRIAYKLTTGLSANKAEVPTGFSLFQNYPNPFNPTTTISYELSANSFVSLKVYDVLGREVTTLVAKTQTAGNHSVTLDASNLPSGVYLYRLQAGIYSNTKKLLLLK